MLAAAELVARGGVAAMASGQTASAAGLLVAAGRLVAAGPREAMLGAAVPVDKASGVPVAEVLVAALRRAVALPETVLGPVVSAAAEQARTALAEAVRLTATGRVVRQPEPADRVRPVHARPVHAVADHA